MSYSGTDLGFIIANYRQPWLRNAAASTLTGYKDRDAVYHAATKRSICSTYHLVALRCRQTESDNHIGLDVRILTISVGPGLIICDRYLQTVMSHAL